MVALIFLLIFLLAAIGVFSYSIYLSKQLINNPQKEVNYKSYFKKEIYLLIAFVISFSMMLILIYSANKITPKIFEILQGIFGGIIFSFSIFAAINSFIVHYYKKELPEKIKNYLHKVVIYGFILTIVSFFITLNGYADYFTYPLVNGISLSKGFVTPDESANIAFYALCILAGAILVYFIADHNLYKEYGKHGLLETTFLIAFPAGIIGARLFYVIGNFNVPVGEGGFGGVLDYHVFALWEGGLTILGGAIVGIVAGVTTFMIKNKGYNIWLVIDLVVPTILIAQAIGRWGNFFNLEVHGLASDESYWWWLPRVVFNNAHYSTSTGFVTSLSNGKLYVPLFFIEGIINLSGYFLIAIIFGKKLRKYTELGDLAFGYVIWYGLTRTILEPLRDPSYNMGNDGYWSWLWSMVFIIVGCILIFLNHLLRDLSRKKNKSLNTNVKNNRILSLILGVITIILLVIGMIFILNGTYTGKIAYSLFNVGTIIIILGIAMIFICLIPVCKTCTYLWGEEK